MAQEDLTPDRERSYAGFSLALVGVMARVGCLTLLLVIVPLALGLWIDLRLDTQPIITVLLVLVSFPLTMYMIYRVVLRSTAGLSSQAGSEHSQLEEVDRGETP